jgi:hypothetical protein
MNYLQVVQVLRRTPQWSIWSRREHGAPPIDLVDGNAFAENLKKLGLGVKIRVAEEVSVDREWFKDI